MKFLERIERNFWLFFILGIVIGLLIPNQVKFLADYVVYFLMIMLFVVFLKIDLKEILRQIRRPLLLSYIVVINMVFVPFLVYALSFYLDIDLITGLVLIATVPSGFSAAALTDIIKGKTSLALVITVISSFIAPLTIPSVFYFLLRTKIELEAAALFLTIVKLIFIPFILSQLTKLFFKDLVNISKKNSGGITVIFGALIILGVIAKEAEYVMTNLSEIFHILIILYSIFFIFQIGSYFMCFWLKKEEKIAISNSKTFMNTALGIVLALQFFNPKVALILILSEIPWSTMLVVFKAYLRYLP